MKKTILGFLAAVAILISSVSLTDVGGPTQPGGDVTRSGPTQPGGDIK